MEKLVHWFLVLNGFSTAFSQTDMYHKAFVLPKESDDSFVILKAQLEKPLTAFTVCLYTYTDVPRDYSLFSYATRKQDNEILLFWARGRGYLLSVGGEEVLFPSPEVTTAPVHVCANWDSATGITELWVNGKPRVRRSLKKGYSLGVDASIVLGQEQDSFGGSFDKKQSLVGDIGNVNMWDFVLTPEDISTLYAGGTLSPNILNWQALKYETHGEVFTQPPLWF